MNGYKQTVLPRHALPVTNYVMNDTIMLITSLALAVFAWWSWWEARQARVDANKAREKTNTTNIELEEQNRLLSIYRESDEPASCKLSKDGKIYTLYMFRHKTANGMAHERNGFLYIDDQKTSSADWTNSKFRIIDQFLRQWYTIETNVKTLGSGDE